jgi:acetolactate synthase-1/2/3 large subunit
MMGDGGLGIGGMDIETAQRYNLPVVYLIYNNSSWISNFREHFLPQLESWDMLPDIRYDKMFEVLGCHTEHVEDPVEIRPALERAFNSGKTSVINVIPDSKVMQPFSVKMGQGLAVSPWAGINNMSKEAPKILGIPAPKTE